MYMADLLTVPVNLAGLPAIVCWLHKRRTTVEQGSPIGILKKTLTTAWRIWMGKWLLLTPKEEQRHELWNNYWFRCHASSKHQKCFSNTSALQTKYKANVIDQISRAFLSWINVLEFGRVAVLLKELYPFLKIQNSTVKTISYPFDSSKAYQIFNSITQLVGDGWIDIEVVKDKQNVFVLNVFTLKKMCGAARTGFFMWT